jgi:hypothetical protein
MKLTGNRDFAERIKYRGEGRNARERIVEKADERCESAAVVIGR